MTSIIPEALVPQTREQIAEYHRLRDLTRDLVDVGEKICKGRIGETRREEGVKKKSTRHPTGERLRR